jgi:hypothetical protein
LALFLAPSKHKSHAWRNARFPQPLRHQPLYPLGPPPGRRSGTPISGTTRQQGTMRLNQICPSQNRVDLWGNLVGALWPHALQVMHAAGLHGRGRLAPNALQVAHAAGLHREGRLAARLGRTRDGDASRPLPLPLRPVQVRTAVFLTVQVVRLTLKTTTAQNFLSVILQAALSLRS